MSARIWGGIGGGLPELPGRVSRRAVYCFPHVLRQWGLGGGGGVGRRRRGSVGLP